MVGVFHSENLNNFCLIKKYQLLRQAENIYHATVYWKVLSCECFHPTEKLTAYSK